MTELIFSSNSVFDNFGFYAGPLTGGERVKFGVFGDPGINFGTLEQRVTASQGTLSFDEDGAEVIVAPEDWDWEFRGQYI
jgi:hypothetical protein